jgi:hypothetical protein
VRRSSSSVVAVRSFYDYLVVDGPTRTQRDPAWAVGGAANGLVRRVVMALRISHGTPVRSWTPAFDEPLRNRLMIALACDGGGCKQPGIWKEHASSYWRK